MIKVTAQALENAFQEGRQSTTGTDRHRADDAWRNSRAKRLSDAAREDAENTPPQLPRGRWASFLAGMVAATAWAVLLWAWANAAGVCK